MENMPARTLFGLLDRPDEIVHKVLQITQRIRDARSPIHLRERCIEDRDDVLQQVGSVSLQPNRSAIVDFFRDHPTKKSEKRCSYDLDRRAYLED